MSGFQAGFDVAETAIEQHFRAGWAGRTPVHWPDDPDFEPPKDLSAWVRFSSQEGAGTRLTIGRPARFQWTGLVVVQVFTLAGRGPGPSARLCDAVASIFGDRHLLEHDIKFGAPDAPVIGRSGAWFQRNVRTPYTRTAVTGGP